MVHGEVQEMIPMAHMLNVDCFYNFFKECYKRVGDEYLESNLRYKMIAQFIGTLVEINMNQKHLKIKNH